MADDAWDILEERPFSYLLKIRSGRWEREGERISCLAGSPENVLANCEMDPQEKKHATETLATITAEGMRVIGIAERDGDLPLDADIPWRFIGFLGMGDDLRPHVVESVTWCRDQGIRVVMITGDHPSTAFAIAKKAGIATNDTEVLNGPELEAMDDAAFSNVIDRIRVFSRIAPTHKLRIINAFRAHGYLTAMTGDGVNDAPALHQADIGIAMGKSGTDVAREAAHLVLLDDNFATIIAAIQEGRVTVSNVRRVIMYLFSTSAAEAGVITLALILNMPLPLLPGQIIWINLVTDSFLDISLAMEPQHGSRHATNGALIDRRSIIRMSLLAATMTAGTFILYLHNLDVPSVAYRYTITLTTLAAFQWLNAWNARSETRSLMQLSPISNPYLIAATATVIGLHLLAMHTQPLQGLLGLTPLSGSDWAIIIAIVSTVILVDELWKKIPHPQKNSVAVS
jgi:magnesium-transporting ATPase (P-type)